MSNVSGFDDDVPDGPSSVQLATGVHSWKSIQWLFIGDVQWIQRQRLSESQRSTKEERQLPREW